MWNKYKLLTQLLAIVIIATQVLMASAPRVGTSCASELRIPMGARSVALNGANLASVSGSEAIYWNPAGVARLDNVEAVFSYMNYFADMKISYMAAGVNLNRLGNLGVSMQVMDIGDIYVTTVEAPEGTGEIINPNYFTMTGTYSKRFTDRIYFGTNLKVISERIGNMNATGVGFDIGLQYISPWNVSFGVCMKNIGPKMKFDGTGIEFDAAVPYAGPNATTRKTKLDLSSNQLPASMSLGFGYNFAPSESHSLNISGAYNNNSFAIDKLATGLEYAFRNMLFLRAGYAITLFPDDYPDRAQDENQYGLTAGAGWHLKLGNTRLLIDYAYRDMQLFDANQYFSIGFQF